MIAVVPIFFCCLVLWSDNSKTIWSRYYLDDFNTAKVKILDIRRGSG